MVARDIGHLLLDSCAVGIATLLLATGLHLLRLALGTFHLQPVAAAVCVPVLGASIAGEVHLSLWAALGLSTCAFLLTELTAVKFLMDPVWRRGSTSGLSLVASFSLFQLTLMVIEKGVASTTARVPIEESFLPATLGVASSYHLVAIAIAAMVIAAAFAVGKLTLFIPKLLTLHENAIHLRLHGHDPEATRRSALLVSSSLGISGGLVLWLLNQGIRVSDGQPFLMMAFSVALLLRTRPTWTASLVALAAGCVNCLTGYFWTQRGANVALGAFLLLACTVRLFRDREEERLGNREVSC